MDQKEELVSADRTIQYIRESHDDDKEQKGLRASMADRESEAGTSAPIQNTRLSQNGAPPRRDYVDERMANDAHVLTWTPLPVLPSTVKQIAAQWAYTSEWKRADDLHRQVVFCFEQDAQLMAQGLSGATWFADYANHQTVMFHVAEGKAAEIGGMIALRMTADLILRARLSRAEKAPMLGMYRLNMRVSEKDTWATLLYSEKYYESSADTPHGHSRQVAVFKYPHIDYVHQRLDRGDPSILDETNLMLYIRLITEAICRCVKYTDGMPCLITGTKMNSALKLKQMVTREYMKRTEKQ